MSDLWNAKTYSQFLDLRTRPARDLLAAVPESFQPNIVYDLGCGPGNSTILLKERWPQAAVIGIDSSLDMLKEAKETYPHLQFIQEDIANFSPDEPIDFLFANASLQWLNEHNLLIPKLLGLLNPKGGFALQIPNNFHAPSHQIALQLLQDNVHWQPLLKKLPFGHLTEPFYNLSHYYDWLTQAKASHLQLWETEYWQEMTDYRAIFNWIKGTGLHPALSVMDTNHQNQYAEAYIEAIAKVYPLQANHKILFPYRRMFMVGFIVAGCHPTRA